MRLSLFGKWVDPLCNLSGAQLWYTRQQRYMVWRLFFAWFSLHRCSITLLTSTENFRERTFILSQNALIIIYVHWFSIQLIPLLHFSSHRNWNITAEMITLEIRTFMLMIFFRQKIWIELSMTQRTNTNWKRELFNPDDDLCEMANTHRKKKLTATKIFPDECATANRTLFKLLKTKTDRCWTTPNRFYIWFAVRPLRRASKRFFFFFLHLDIFFSLHFYSLTF